MQPCEAGTGPRSPAAGDARPRKEAAGGRPSAVALKASRQVTQVGSGGVRGTEGPLGSCCEHIWSPHLPCHGSYAPNLHMRKQPPENQPLPGERVRGGKLASLRDSPLATEPWSQRKHSQGDSRPRVPRTRAMLRTLPPFALLGWEGREPRPRSRSRVRPLLNPRPGCWVWGRVTPRRDPPGLHRVPQPPRAPTQLCRLSPPLTSRLGSPGGPMAEGRPGLLGPRSPPGPAPSTCLAGILSMSRLNPRLAGRWPLNDQGGPSGAACAQGSVFPGPQGPQRPLRPGSPHTSWVTVTPPLPGKQGWSHTGKTIPGPGDPRLEADCQSGTRRVSGRAALTHNVGLRSPPCQQEGSAQPSLLQLRDQVRSRPWSCGGRGGGLRGELGAGQGFLQKPPGDGPQTPARVLSLRDKEEGRGWGGSQEASCPCRRVPQAAVPSCAAAPQAAAPCSQ